MITLRWFCMHKHLQCFINSVIRSAKLLAATRHNSVATTNIATLKTRIKTRINYLIPCASQYFAHIVFISSICILIHRSSPNGINVCPMVRTLFGLDLDILMKVIQKEREFDATKVALEIADQPYFSSAIMSFLMGTGIGKISPSKKLIQFIEKCFTKLRFIPVGTFIPFGKAMISVYCLSFFFVNTLGLIVWKLYPGMYLMYSGGVIVNIEKVSDDKDKKKI